MASNCHVEALKATYEYFQKLSRLPRTTEYIPSWEEPLEKYFVDQSDILTAALQEMHPSRIAIINTPVSDLDEETPFTVSTGLFFEASCINDDVPSAHLERFVEQMWGHLQSWIAFIYPATGNVVGDALAISAMNIATIYNAVGTSRTLATPLLSSQIDSLGLIFDMFRFYDVYIPANVWDVFHRTHVEAQLGEAFEQLLDIDSTAFLRGLLAAFSGDKRGLVRLLTDRAYVYTREYDYKIEDGWPNKASLEHLSIIRTHARLVEALVLSRDSACPSYPKGVTSKWLRLFDVNNEAVKNVERAQDRKHPFLFLATPALSSLWRSANGERHLVLCLKKHFLERLGDLAQGLLEVDMPVVDGVLELVECGLVSRSAALAVAQHLREYPSLPPTIKNRQRSFWGCHDIMRVAMLLQKRLLRVCSNEQCTRKAYSGALRRCPCGLSNYCSRACQQADWEARHRSACGLRTYDLVIAPRVRSHFFCLALIIIVIGGKETLSYSRRLRVADNIVVSLDFREGGLMDPVPHMEGKACGNELKSARQLSIVVSFYHGGYGHESVKMPDLPLSGLHEVGTAHFGRLEVEESQWWDCGGHFIPAE